MIIFRLLLFILFFIPAVGLSEPFGYDNPILSNKVKVYSWKTQRDWGIVKQNYDFSCGAASLATLLNNFYGLNISEEEILIAMNKREMAASFYDMQIILPQIGFVSKGFALSYDDLMTIKIPVIVYLNYRRNNHFSVLTGINAKTVSLADPNWGHITMSKEQFIKSWHTTNQETAGKILAIVPTNEEMFILSNSNFFDKNPKRSTDFIVKQFKKPMRNLF